MPALDYGLAVAALYDDYCLFAEDAGYFGEVAHAHAGPLLELMAGTGRVSIPMVLGGARLTCLDLSLPMLEVLGAKRRRRGLAIDVVCGDVRSLPFARGRFGLVVLPFHGLCELLTVADRAALFRAVRGVLAPAGTFVCTFHNRAVRVRALDGEWRVLGEVPRSGGGTLRLSLRGAWDEASGLVVGEQRLETITGEPPEPTAGLLMPLRFSLPSLDEVLGLARGTGFEPVAVYGDYARSQYDPERSPFVIVELETVR